MEAGIEGVVFEIKNRLNLVDTITKQANSISRMVGCLATEDPDNFENTCMIAAMLYNIRFDAINAVLKGDLVTRTQVFDYIKLVEESAGVQIKPNKDES